MTNAYEEILLERAADSLGRMLDYSVYSLHYDIAVMMDLFTASGSALLFERGDIRTITGMSGIELAYEVLERSGIAFQRTQQRYTKGFSPEYWYGQALARIQHETCLPFHHILRAFPPAAFISSYGKSRLAFLDSLPLDLDAEMRSAEIRSFGRDHAEKAVSDFISSNIIEEDAAAGRKLNAGVVAVGSGKADESALKRMRIKNGFSQSGLAKAAGIPVRTIQQYEQGQKDIRKARAEYIIALSRALNCDPSYLLIT